MSASTRPCPAAPGGSAPGPPPHFQFFPHCTSYAQAQDQGWGDTWGSLQGPLPPGANWLLGSLSPRAGQGGPAGRQPQLWPVTSLSAQGTTRPPFANCDSVLARSLGPAALAQPLLALSRGRWPQPGVCEPGPPQLAQAPLAGCLCRRGGCCKPREIEDPGREANREPQRHLSGSL